VNAMPKRYVFISAPASVDDFQLAAAKAQSEAGDRWIEMPVKEQARAIYAHLRQIDARRAATTHVAAEERGAFNDARVRQPSQPSARRVPRSHFDRQLMRVPLPEHLV
jgi:acyl-CoA reductase-like NAD-dependent aldehyde dehydrogenase